MLSEKAVKGKGGGEILLPQLDRFGGERSLSCGGGSSEWRYGSEGYAWERHVDEYLEEIAPYIARVARVTGPGRATYVINTLRNSSDFPHKGDRLEAAKAVAGMMKDWVKIKRSMRGLDVYLDWDGYEPVTAWVWLGGEFTRMMLGICGGRVWFGRGDGYHRDWDHLGNEGEVWADEEDGTEHVVKSYEPGDIGMVLDLVAEARRQIEIGKKYPCPCDEKYWHSYYCVKRMLEKKRNRRRS